MTMIAVCAQAAKGTAAQEALALRQEVERVMACHQERVANWEAAAAADEAQLGQRKSALEVQTPAPPLMTCGMSAICSLRA